MYQRPCLPSASEYSSIRIHFLLSLTELTSRLHRCDRPSQPPSMTVTRVELSLQISTSSSSTFRISSLERLDILNLFMGRLLLDSPVSIRPYLHFHPLIFLKLRTTGCSICKFHSNGTVDYRAMTRRDMRLHAFAWRLSTESRCRAAPSGRLLTLVFHSNFHEKKKLHLMLPWPGFCSTPSSELRGRLSRSGT